MPKSHCTYCGWEGYNPGIPSFIALFVVQKSKIESDYVSVKQ